MQEVSRGRRHYDESRGISSLSSLLDIFIAYAPASAASRAKRIVSLVHEPPTPATIGLDDSPASSRVVLMNRMSFTRSS